MIDGPLLFGTNVVHLSEVCCICYCMMIWADILVKADSVGPTEVRDDSKVNN